MIARKRLNTVRFCVPNSRYVVHLFRIPFCLTVRLLVDNNVFFSMASLRGSNESPNSTFDYRSDVSAAESVMELAASLPLFGAGPPPLAQINLHSVEQVGLGRRVASKVLVVLPANSFSARKLLHHALD